MAKYETQKTIGDLWEEDLWTSLAAIKEIDGYNWTVAEVVGWGADDFPWSGVWPAVGVVIGEESRDDIFSTSNRRCKATFGLEMWVPAPTMDRTKPIFSRCYRSILADLEKALLTGAGYYRNGYAEDTKLTTAQPMIDAGRSLLGCALTGLVIYRHRVADLYTQT